MITLRLVAAGNPTKSPDAFLGLVVFLGIAVILVFLFRSMNKHLRKATATKPDDASTPAAAAPAVRAAQPKRPAGRKQGPPPTPTPRPRS